MLYVVDCSIEHLLNDGYFTNSQAKSWFKDILEQCDVDEEDVEQALLDLCPNEDGTAIDWNEAHNLLRFEPEPIFDYFGVEMNESRRRRPAKRRLERRAIRHRR